MQFKEVKDLKALSTRANTIAIILLVVTMGLIYLRAGRISFGIGMFAAYVVFLVVHEFLHAVWYKGDVYMFQNLRNGLLFIPLLLIASAVLGLKGIQYSQAIADVMTSLVCIPFTISFFAKIPKEQ